MARQDWKISRRRSILAAMSFFLLRYHRPSGRLLSCVELSDRSDAYARRRRLEADKPAEEEVIVLEGDSLATVQKTHARYFRSARELVEAADAVLPH